MIDKATLQAEKANLERKLAARDRAGVEAFKQNVAAIRARLAEIDRLMASE